MTTLFPIFSFKSDSSAHLLLFAVWPKFFGNNS